MVGPAGVGFPNKINSLGRPTAPDRGVECKDEFRPFPNLPNRPETDKPLLDAWLASGDPIAWIGLLGGETIDD